MDTTSIHGQEDMAVANLMQREETLPARRILARAFNINKMLKFVHKPKNKDSTTILLLKFLNTMILKWCLPFLKILFHCKYVLNVVLCDITFCLLCLQCVIINVHIFFIIYGILILNNHL